MRASDSESAESATEAGFSTKQAFTTEQSVIKEEGTGTESAGKEETRGLTMHRYKRVISNQIRSAFIVFQITSSGSTWCCRRTKGHTPARIIINAQDARNLRADITRLYDVGFKTQIRHDLVHHLGDVFGSEVPVHRRPRGERVPRQRGHDEVIGQGGGGIPLLDEGEEGEEFREVACCGY